MPRDPRLYITVDVGMPDHPKVEALSSDAFRLLVTLWCWSARQLTDGVIRSGSWLNKGSEGTRAELVEAGLVEVTADGTAHLHDYTEHQRTAQEVAELRSKRAEAGRQGGLAKKANALALAKQNGSKPVADTDTDTTSKASGARSRKERATKIPPDWKPTDSHLAYCIEHDLDPAHQLRQFKTNAEAKGLRYVQWNSAFSTWLGNAQQWGQTATAAGSRREISAAPIWSAPPPPADMPGHLFGAWHEAHLAAHKAGNPGPSDWHELRQAS